MSDKWGVRFTVILIAILTAWFFWEFYAGITDITPSKNDLCGDQPQSGGYCTE